jgi:hypothetical protein
VQQPGAQSLGAVVLQVEVGCRVDGEVQVQHLWPGSVRPGGCWQVGDLLERDPGCSGVAGEHEPVAAAGVG